MEKLENLTTKYNDLIDIKKILESWNIKWLEFIYYTEMFLNLYESNNKIKSLEKFYLKLKDAYEDKMKEEEKIAKINKELRYYKYIIHSLVVNNINYKPKIKEQD